MNRLLALFVVLGVAAPLSGQVRIQGAGATFPETLYQKLFAAYSRKAGVQVTYQGLGSGAGIKNISDGIVDFGASDAPLSDREIATFRQQGSDMIHLPAALAAVNVAYNMTGVTANINLTADVITRIFDGKITRWNDPAIVELNKNISLPNLAIRPVYRSDSSGTTYVFSEAMSKASSLWSDTFGQGKTLNWTSGVGQKGNSGVAAYVKQTAGAIGYMDYAYVIQSSLKAAKIKNKAGNFVIGDTKAASASAASSKLPADLRGSITFSAGANDAPISTFSYLLVRTEQNYSGRTQAQAKALVDMLVWMYSAEAQAQHEGAQFAPLPKSVVDQSMAQLKKITYNGVAILK
ncbi:MAG: phosphate ABC transporter substrate-binding protein PstS [Brevinema sp.]